jgi:hypothetical protein
MKPGTKLKSAVCATEILVIKGVPDAVVCCGGAPMLGEAPAALGTPHADFAGGSQIGKRYRNEAGTIELLCIKPGAGSVSVDGVALRLKDARPLPSSD